TSLRSGADDRGVVRELQDIAGHRAVWRGAPPGDGRATRFHRGRYRISALRPRDVPPRTEGQRQDNASKVRKMGTLEVPRILVGAVGFSGERLAAGAGSGWGGQIVYSPSRRTGRLTASAAFATIHLELHVT